MMDKDEQDKENLVYYYSRERRLARAPQRVQNLYNTPGRKRPSFLKTLIPSRSSALLFITILVVMVFLFVNNRPRGLLKGERGGISLEGNGITISGRVYKDETYLTMKKKAESQNAYIGPAEIAVSIPEESMPLENYKVFFSLASEEEFQFSVPFEAPKLLILIKNGEKMATLQVKIN